MSVNEVKIQPAPFELEVRGTGHPSSRTFAIGDEDHTLGNALRHVLMQNAKVEFAGYSVPHPSEPVVQIRVQTAPKSKNLHLEQQQRQRQLEGGDDDDDVMGGSNEQIGVNCDEEGNDRLGATDALKEACETLIGQCDIVLDQVEELMPEVRQDRMDLEDQLRNEGYDEDGEEMPEDGDEIEGDGDYDDEMM